MSLQEPLLVSYAVQGKGQAPSTQSAWLRRAGVVIFCLLASGGLAWALPTNKNLPCPFCQVSSFLGWLYFFFWSIR